MTKLIYLEDTYLFKAIAKVMEIKNTEFGQAIILDQTVFYPQGGGQPCDQGKIYSGKGVFIVSKVQLDENGVVYHFGEFESGNFEKDEIVDLEIDSKRRIINAKNHSAGHLIDCAVSKAGLSNLKPIKGYHFPEGPYIEYEGEVVSPDELVLKIEKITNDLIQEKLLLKKEKLSFEEARKMGIFAPAGKSARIVSFEGFSICGCGGTHISNSGEIGKIKIRKISSKKGRVRIAYLVDVS
ncbi:hypothetical protein A2335_03020 [Candidatus Peregrinibacteria bacterium RIFOXYB2_FULL_32_7]|nr:MAG: hypothetical protein A2335_03020 [Candidatus Peregrinibacteria bacterium RIFOXYB2_FULL_32_7]